MKKWVYNLVFRSPYPILGVVYMDGKDIVSSITHNNFMRKAFVELDPTVLPGSVVYACDCGIAHMVSAESLKPRFRWRRKCLYNNK